MRAIMLKNYGGPEMVVLGEAPKPELRNDQVLVKVSAAGVNLIDYKIRAGFLKNLVPLRLPAILGSEISGTIVDIGAGVAGFSVGDKVHGGAGMTGGYADYVAMAPSQIAKMPNDMGFIEAAAAPVAAITATAALDAGDVKRGTRILIHAAAGGVGNFALQMALLRGAHVTALASPENFDFVRGFGPDQVVDRTGRYEAELGEFDVVLNGATLEAEARSWALLKKGGVLVSLIGPPSEQRAADRDVRTATVFGEPNGDVLAAVDQQITHGDIKVPVTKTYPFEDALVALATSEGGKVRGKLVVAFDR